MTATPDPIDPDAGPDARDESGNLLDGCGDEHSPAKNAGCQAAPVIEDPVVLSKQSEAAPDMTDVIVADMVEGVRRYDGIAADATERAKSYRAEADEQDKVNVEYVGKSAALSALLTRLGYDPATGKRKVIDGTVVTEPSHDDGTTLGGAADVVAVDPTLKSPL